MLAVSVITGTVSKRTFNIYFFRNESQLLCRMKLIELNNQDESVHKIVKIAQLYDELTDTIRLVNQRFAIQVKPW